MSDLTALMEASWPPAERAALGPFVLRRGLGGGQRVSAATVHGPWVQSDVIGAASAMREMGQTPLFMLSPRDADLDLALQEWGYMQKDPVVVLAAPCKDIAGDGPAYMTSFPHWPPMSIARVLWEDGHIGPNRIAIMDRAQGPKTTLLGRTNDRASGVAFVAMSGDVAFVHALHVVASLRRQGAAQNLMRAAALWAGEQGATTLALAVTTANEAALALYTSLGMRSVEHYHYRVWAE